MSGYYFKNIAINTITYPTSYSNNSFVGFPTGTMGGNMYKPYDFGYIDNLGDLSNRCRAVYTNVTYKGNVGVPTGSKAFRYIMVGGGGGGGGGGGSAHVGANSDNINKNANAKGGNGAPGAGGVYYYSNADVRVNSGNIYVNIGEGGQGGYGGSNDNDNVNANMNIAYSKGNDGAGYDKGGKWNPTGGGTTYFTYDGTSSPNAPGGAAGGYGNGGDAQMTNGGNTNGTNNGTTNNPEGQNTSVSVNTDLGGSAILQYGIGGGGGIGATSGNQTATDGGRGSQGVVQFIWLYD